MKKLVFLNLVLCLLIFSCSPQPTLVDRDTLLITLGEGDLSREIGIVELRNNFFVYQGEDPDTAKMRLEQVIDNVIEMHLLALGAQKAGMLDDSTMLQTMQMSEESSVLGELYWQVVINKSKVDSMDIVKLWEDMATEIRCKHVLITDSSLADSLYNVLVSDWDSETKDELFNDIAMNFSTDEGTKSIGGDLDYFAKGRMVPEFEEVAFSLEDGELSQPVQSDFGWHIIYRIDSRDNDRRKPLEDMYPQIANMREQELRRELADAFIDSITDAAEVQIHELGFIVLYKRVSENTSGPFGPGPITFSEEEGALLFMTYSENDITLADLQVKMENREWSVPLFIPDTNEYRDACKRIIMNDVLVKAAEDLSIIDLPVVRRNVYMQIDRSVSWKFIEDSIRSQVEITEEDIEFYYNENSDEFTLPERRRARLIENVSEDTFVNYVLPHLKDGDTIQFDTLAKIHSIHFSSRSGGQLGMFPVGRYPAFDSVIFSLEEEGDISSVFQVDSGHYAVVMVEEIVLETLLPFEDVKVRIEENLRQNLTDSIKMSILEELQNKYPENRVSNYEDIITILISGE